MKFKIIFLPLSVIIAASIFVWAIKPKLDSIKEKRAELNQKKNQLEKIENNIGILKGEVGRISQYSEEKAIVESALPWKDKDADFLSEIYNNALVSGVFIYSLEKKDIKDFLVNSECANSSQLTLASQEVTTEEENDGEKNNTVSARATFCKKPLEKTEVTLKISGEYPNIKGFLEKLIKANRVNKISSIVMNNKSKSEQVSEGSGGSIASTGIEADISLLIFSKEKNSKISLIQVIDQKDEVINSIFNSGADIEKIQELRNNLIIFPTREVSLEGIGKENLFSN